MSDEITLNFEKPGGGTLGITARPSMMHPEQCAFQTTEPVYENHSAFFSSRERGQGSPLIDGLFALDPVTEVLVNHDVVKVTLRDGEAWDDWVARVGAVLRDVIVSGVPPIAAIVAQSQLPPDELRRRVQSILDDSINPAVSAHGGYVEILDVSNNTVFLEFGGGCQGCGMINVTLKYGVEKAIREEIPEVGEILDTTDHAAGRNPYYAPASK